MRGKVTDEYSMDRIVSYGVIPAIKAAVEDEGGTIDGKVSTVRRIVDAYDEYYQITRPVESKVEE